MTLEISIHIDKAALNEQSHLETARILRDLADKVENNDIDAYYHPTTIEIDGKVVVTVEIIEDEK